MKPMGLVKATTLEPFIRFLVGNGINLDPHIRSAHIPPELVEMEDTWVSKQQVYRFLADVASMHHLEALGLIVGDQIMFGLGQADRCEGHNAHSDAEHRSGSQQRYPDGVPRLEQSISNEPTH